MTGKRRQAGASAVLIVLVLVVILIGMLAVSVLSRVGNSGREDSQTATRLATAADALEHFASVSLRLPCPADPTLDTGEEVLAGVATCSFPAGTVPWKTIGMRRDDAYDPWGRKISYRVYTGAAGSLTQPRGVSMVECDTGGTGAATAGAGSEGGLCDSQTRITLRDTSPNNFFVGKPQAPPGKKGFDLKDLGVDHDDVAYVLVSHGAKGLGGYTVSGVQLELPSAGGAERKNTVATGPFEIKAFSDADTAATSPNHFDDLLAYRTLPDLVRRIGLSARDWPEEITTTVTLNQATVETAVGTSVTPGAGVGQTSISVPGAQISGIASGSTPTEISFEVVAGVGGIGVGVGTPIEIMVQSNANEFLRIAVEKATNFAITLAHFGTAGALEEKVELRFYLAGSLVGSPIVKSGCSPDGGLASFTVPVGTLFDQVDITPQASSDGLGGTGITAFLLSEIKGCAATETTCVTSLSQPPNAPNTCP